MGGEIGQLTEWNCNEEIHWHLLQNAFHQKLQNMVKEISRVYLENPALFENESFEWVSKEEPICYFRKNEKQTLLCVHNLSIEKFENYQLPVFGKEIFSSDREEFGGSGILNEPGSVVTIAPLSTVIFHVEERI